VVSAKQKHRTDLAWQCIKATALAASLVVAVSRALSSHPAGLSLLRRFSAIRQAYPRPPPLPSSSPT
jgi:hypothetical protein